MVIVKTGFWMLEASAGAWSFLSWTMISALLCGLTLALIVAMGRIRRLKNQKAEQRQEALQCAELLTYSRERERKVQEELTRISEGQHKLLSRISHEVRTPMNGVIGMSALLAETPLTYEQKEYNDTIRTCSEALLGAINTILHGDILAHAKEDADQVNLDQKDFDLRNSIEEVLNIFAGLAAFSDHDLLLRIDPQVPVNVVGDSHKFRQVITNLLENAMRFTRQGEILIDVRPSSQMATDLSSITLVVEIKDTGTGIGPERLIQLQDELSHPENYTGKTASGVGLFICQKLVKHMGGKMSITSIIEQGTTVSLVLPFGVSNLRANPFTIPAGALSGKRVLVVDDNLTALNILEETLRRWQLEPTIAASGQEAIELLSNDESFDLVLTDLKMRSMDGIKLAQFIRYKHPGIPMMLMCAEGDDMARQHADLFVALIPKPLRLDTLGKQIFSKLRRQGAPGEEKKSNQIMSVAFAEQFPLRVLIAEDNAVNQRLTAKILHKLGYACEIVSNGKEVLELVSNNTYDLILMDVQMPEMDGLEATRMIRLCLTHQPVIVALTANSMQGDREECIQAGMDDYLSKPVHIDELMIILERWAMVVKDKMKAP